MVTNLDRRAIRDIAAESGRLSPMRAARLTRQAIQTQSTSDPRRREK